MAPAFAFLPGDSTTQSVSCHYTRTFLTRNRKLRNRNKKKIRKNTNRRACSFYALSPVVSQNLAGAHSCTFLALRNLATLFPFSTPLSSFFLSLSQRDDVPQSETFYRVCSDAVPRFRRAHKNFERGPQKVLPNFFERQYDYARVDADD